MSSEVKLGHLYISENKLTEWPQNIFEDLITNLPENAFNGLTHMEILFLKDNQLKNVHPNAFNSLDRLRTLYLDGNQLTTLTETIFYGQNQLNKFHLFDLKLAGNPWKCNFKFVDYIAGFIRKIDHNEILCSDGLPLDDKFKQDVFDRWKIPRNSSVRN